MASKISSDRLFQEKKILKLYIMESTADRQFFTPPTFQYKKELVHLYYWINFSITKLQETDK